MPSRSDLANAIRALSMDAVQKANSGHPGAPMGMADIAEVLWRDFLRHNPQNPAWPNRDRFILSNGHGSMLLYSVLHLTGYDLGIEDLKQFRQLHSRTPGPPGEACHLDRIEDPLLRRDPPEEHELVVVVRRGRCAGEVEPVVDDAGPADAGVGRGVAAADGDEAGRPLEQGRCPRQVEPAMER